MELNKEEERICKKFSKPDKYGEVRCKDCPLVISVTYCLCKKNVTKKEYNESWA